MELRVTKDFTMEMGDSFMQEGKFGTPTYRPLQDFARVGKVTYWLELADELGLMHKTFYVS